MCVSVYVLPEFFDGYQERCKDAELRRRKRLLWNLRLIPAVRALRMMLFGITVNVTYFQVGLRTIDFSSINFL